MAEADPKRESRQKLKQAESLRLMGNYSGAVKEFDEAIAADEENAWAWAHRGAAKLGIMNIASNVEELGSVLRLSEALDRHLTEKTPLDLSRVSAATRKSAVFDLAKGLELRGGLYPWAAGQLGEALRLCAVYPPVEDGPVSRYVQRSINGSLAWFDRALRESNDRDAWSLAHRGATRTFMYWMHGLLPETEVRQQDTGAAARRDFDRALEVNPLYSWAMAFKAFLLTLEHDYNTARAALGAALVSDVHGQLVVQRALCELGSFYRPDKDGEDESKQMWENAVQFGWRALQLDQDDFFAMYYIAACLHRLGASTAPAAIATARTRLHGVRNQIDMMLGGLSIMDPSVNADAWKISLIELEKHMDMETVAMIQHDPTWDAVRKDPRYVALMNAIQAWLK